MAITSPTYDPATTAAALADNYVAARQGIQTSQTQKASAAASALNSLRSAISSYQSSLLALGSSQSMLTMSASFSNTAVGAATATAAATPGSYSFFAEQLATSSQVAYSGLADTLTAAGSLGIELDGDVAFTVDLGAADTDGNSILTARELALAINAAPDNKAKVSASIVTINGKAELILTAQATGAKSVITLDISGVTDDDLKTSLDPANARTVVKAQDAKIWLGAEGSGTLIEQASNSFTNIEGVTMAFIKAQAAGEAPVTLTVATDSASTISNVQKFVTEYNKLKGTIDAMVAPGDPSKGKAAGVFSDDGGVRVLQTRLVSILRQAGASSLAAYGITAARDGSLTLDSARLTRQLAVDPDGLDKLVGKASATTPTGIAGDLDTYLKQWSSNVNGQIKQRLEANDRLKVQLDSRQEVLDKQYNTAYQRYLMQFTMLQSVQSQMNSNSSMLDALFGKKTD